MIMQCHHLQEMCIRLKHEETDTCTRLFFHASHASQKDLISIMIHASDTDQCFSHRHGSIKLYVKLWIIGSFYSWCYIVFYPLPPDCSMISRQTITEFPLHALSVCVVIPCHWQRRLCWYDETCLIWIIPLSKALSVVSTKNMGTKKDMWKVLPTRQGLYGEVFDRFAWNTITHIFGLE